MHVAVTINKSRTHCSKQKQLLVCSRAGNLSPKVCMCPFFGVKVIPSYFLQALFTCPYPSSSCIRASSQR